MKLFRRTPRLASPTRTVTDVTATHLEIVPAGDMIIVEVDAASVPAIQAGLRKKETVRVQTASASVWFIPGTAIPVRDPKRGWMVPVPAQAADALRAAPGDYELTPQLAVVVV